MVKVETHPSLGHLHSIALCLCSCSHGPLRVGWEGRDWGMGTSLTLTPAQCSWSGSPCSQCPLTRWPKSGSHQQERVQAGSVGPLQTTIPEHPHLHVVKQLPPSAWKGPICHQKRRPLLFFFCILINTEEAGAVKFILGKLQNWFIWCCGTSYCFQYTISNQPFCILVFSFHFDKHCNYSY